jgi:NTP pyrophosphatase (non-canonical NTP hydrolase)
MRNKENVVKWAADRGLLKRENSFAQFTKVVEEVSEIGTALAKGKMHDLEDAIGDTTVTLIILAEQVGLDIEDCLESAYNVIKDRKGKMEGGVFVKEN